MVKATASDQRSPWSAKNLICRPYRPNELLETSSHVKNSRGFTIIVGPETPWAGEISINAWASASLKTLFITASDKAAVCGGNPWITALISILFMAAISLCASKGKM